MKKDLYTISENVKLIENIFKMTLQGDTASIQRPGQFINIALPGHFLRRPISVCDNSDTDVTIVYKIVGKGTAYMSSLCKGDKLDILSGLGNGYDTSVSGDKPLLIGGGVGTPPIYGLAKKLQELKVTPEVILGFRTKADVFFIKEFEALGIKVTLTTEDGSAGIKGYVTEGMKHLKPSYIYACGREEMLRAVYGSGDTDGQYSFEERMACGFGACMGCSCKTVTGYKRICKDGPILRRDEILWTTSE